MLGRRQSHARPTGGLAVEAKERQRDTRRPRGAHHGGGREAKSELDSHSPGSARCGVELLVRPGGRLRGGPSLCREQGLLKGVGLGSQKYLGLSGTKKTRRGVFQLGPRRPPAPTSDSGRRRQQQQFSTHPDAVVAHTRCRSRKSGFSCTASVCVERGVPRSGRRAIATGGPKPRTRTERR